MSAGYATHLAIGFSKGLMADFDRLLPPRSVLVIEEHEIIAARRVRERIAAHPSCAGVLEAPIHDEDDPAGVLAALEQTAAPTAVFPSVEYGVVAAAVIAADRGLPGAGTSAARLFRDKALMRTRLADAGVPQPRWQLADGTADVAEFLAQEGRCVLKPTSSQASLGVQILKAGDDPDAAWRATASVSDRMRAVRAPCGTLLLEEYLTGPEFSVECLVDAGTVVFTNVTAKTVLPGRRPVELGHAVPAPLPDWTRELLADLMVLLVRVTGFGTGVLHAEWILRDWAEPCLVECAARLPGDDIDTLIDLAYGGSLVADLLRLLEGGASAPRPQRSARGAAIRFLTCPPGVVRTVSGREAAEHAAGVLGVVVNAELGATVSDLHSSRDRIGHVIATGESGAQADLLARAAAELIKVST